MGFCHERLLLEIFHPVVVAEANHTETADIIILRRDILGNDGDIRTLGDMILQNLVVVQLVDTVTGSDHNIRLMRILQEIDILIQCICSTFVPVAVSSCDGRCEDIQTALLTSEIPPFGRIQMLIQRSGIVLRIYGNPLNMGVGHVRQCKVDRSVAACYRHSRNRTLCRKFLHPAAVTTC